ncbi:hypothetical protein NDU88_003040 [Pleurodeles waltl]|uniref:Uncharacterized protein n=1 Tax=Pleurodeles waltl TaxID=8319 RepID=A0AAV7M5S6_PLEWA|nr:hypothetical protein NDU88_003040 [Pleurodeles waltl]
MKAHGGAAQTLVRGARARAQFKARRPQAARTWGDVGASAVGAAVWWSSTGGVRAPPGHQLEERAQPGAVRPTSRDLASLEGRSLNPILSVQESRLDSRSAMSGIIEEEELDYEEETRGLCLGCRGVHGGRSSSLFSIFVIKEFHVFNPLIGIPLANRSCNVRASALAQRSSSARHKSIPGVAGAFQCMAIRRLYITSAKAMHLSECFRFLG